VISQVTLRPLRTIVGMTTIATVLFGAWNAYADQRGDALDAAIPAAMQKASVAGAIVGIWQDGHAPYVRTFGERNVATREPMAPDLYMRIGSTSKTFTVTAMLLLADQGKLGLDDPIDRYVIGVPSGNQITLRQLAAMRSGLYNYSDETNQDLPQQPFRQWSPRELVEVAYRHPLLFPPGSAFDYSNTNTVLLGMVVENASGQSLASFIEQHILQPLGMTHTVFPVGAEMPAPHARGYFKMPDGTVVDATDWNPSWGWASGNMISTLEDLRVWAHDFAMGKLLSPAMKRERDQFMPAPQEGDGALYGLAIENQNGWIGHNGNTMSYMAYPYYLPSEGITMVVLLNSGVDIPGSWAMMQDITRIITPNNLWPGLPKQ